MKRLIVLIILFIVSFGQAQNTRVLGPNTRVVGLDTITSDHALTIDPITRRLKLTEIQAATGTSSLEQYAEVNAFPATGNTLVLYYAQDNRSLYTWDATNTNYVKTYAGLENLTAGNYIDIQGTSTDPIINVVTSQFVNSADFAPVRNSAINNTLNNVSLTGQLQRFPVTYRTFGSSDIFTAGSLENLLATINYETDFIAIQSTGITYLLIKNTVGVELNRVLNTEGNIVNFSFYRFYSDRNIFSNRYGIFNINTTPVSFTNISPEYTAYSYNGADDGVGNVLFATSDVTAQYTVLYSVVAAVSSSGTGGANQQLSRAGDVISLQNGGSVDISDKQDNLVSGTSLKTVNGENLLGSGNIVVSGGSGGSTNPNEFVVSNISDLTNPANAGKIACIQSSLTQTEDITLANSLILKDCGGVLLVNGFRLTGQDNGLIPDGKKVLIDAFTGTIDGTWNTPSLIYSTNFGLIGDAKELKDGAMTSGSAVLTSATANFTAADIGKVIGVRATQNEFNPVQPSNSRGTTIATIVSVESATSCTLSVAATRTESGTLFRYGSDNFTAGMNALYVRNQKPGTFIFSQGKYMKTEVDYNSLNPPVTRFGSIPNNWHIGVGTDDIHVRGEAATIMSLPNNLDGVHSFTLKDTHRSSVKNLIFDGEFQYHNHVGNFADEAQHGLVIQTAAYNCTVKDVDIVNYTGDGIYMSGDLQFTNAIKGSGATGYPGVSEFVTGSIDETTGQFVVDATKARTNVLIDVTGFQFENTRAINPSRDGARHYQFSGSSFAGWSGLKNPIYKAYYYGSGGQADFIGVSEEREFYKTYTFPDGVESMLLVIDSPDDLTVIDAQLRANVDPRGTVMDNVNVSDCGRHGAANLSSYTTWTNSVIENIGNTLPAFGINIEDQRRSATNYLFQNLTFRDCYSGGLNLVGTVNVDVIACKFEGTTDPGRLLHPDYMGAIGGWRGRNFKAIGNYINRGTFSVGRSGVYSDNIVHYGSLAFEANGAVFRDGQLHQTVVTNVGGQSVNHRTLSYLQDTRMTYDRSMGVVFTNTNMYYNIENVEVIANEVSRLNNEVTPDAYEEIVLDGNNYLFNQTPAPTLDFGGIIENLKFSGARPVRSSRDFVSNNDWPVTDYYGKNYSESSITLSYGFPKDRTIENLTIDGWLDLGLTQFENSAISATPTLTFENLRITIPASEFDWTNTGAYVFETRAKNVNVVINKGLFDLQQTSGVIGSSNRFVRFAQLGFLECNDCTFKSASPKTIDFNNTLQFPASTGPITLRNPQLENITFIPRPQDQIIFTDAPDGSETIINAGTNVTVNGTGTTGDPYVINSTASGSGASGWEQTGTTTFTNQDLVSVNNGKLLIDGVNENAIVYKRTGTIGTGNHVDPVFETGRIVGTGIGEPTWRILYSDSGSDTNEYNSGESLIFAVEPSGTTASVRRKVGSHFEGFIDGQSEPFFRMESIDLDPGVGVTQSVRLRMGPGGTTANDVELIRRGANQLSLALGGSNKWTTFADGFQLESGITANYVNTPTTPSNPGTGVIKVYNKNGVLTQLDDTGTETSLAGGGAFDPTTDKILSDGDNLSPLLGVSNTVGANSFQGDFYVLNGIVYLRSRNATTSTNSSMRIVASALDPVSDATVDLGGSITTRWRNLRLSGTVFATGLNAGGSGTGFLKDNGTVDTNSYLRTPTIAQYGINRTATINEANGTVNFNNGATLTYTIPASSSVSFPLGAKILVNNENATSVTLTPDTGVTLVGASDGVLNNDQAAILVHMTTDEWLVIKLN
ncbi:hypothetical protein [Aquimarina spongiae]|uniref:Uncharacterized protein n=1 Tax=Aquimarina spongiae TaxID=570521 RepID=A0A1M6JFY6_9FLAO|nr:hypothetical protein [Aquimarina spongiae]SHJ45502.1 hypothetical protein SAMN04488508_10943 [Aquimarina spongiae]